ncbi:MAG: hypothetical protein JKY65_04415 [Planctomycetes bacterium]|nr:hypothetical protein [Planctomycetota bacterium]
MAAQMPVHRQSNRAFGFSIMAMLLMFSLIYWLVRRDLPVPTLAAAATMALFAILVPNLLWPFNRIWAATFAKLMSWLLTNLTLLVMFFGIVTPVALYMRLIGRDALCLKPSEEESYFVTVEVQTNAESLLEVF